MMGLGNALTEEFIVEKGRVVTDRLARYRMPNITQTPEIVSIVVEHPTADGPYGAKGIGEISSIPTTPAITNAIYNAVGVRVRRLPVDQDGLAREIALRRASSRSTLEGHPEGGRASHPEGDIPEGIALRREAPWKGIPKGIHTRASPSPRSTR